MVPRSTHGNAFLSYSGSISFDAIAYVTNSCLQLTFSVRLRWSSFSPNNLLPTSPLSPISTALVNKYSVLASNLRLCTHLKDRTHRTIIRRHIRPTQVIASTACIEINLLFGAMNLLLQHPFPLHSRFTCNSQSRHHLLSHQRVQLTQFQPLPSYFWLCDRSPSHSVSLHSTATNRNMDKIHHSAVTASVYCVTGGCWSFLDWISFTIFWSKLVHVVFFNQMVDMFCILTARVWFFCHLTQLLGPQDQKD